MYGGNSPADQKTGDLEQNRHGKIGGNKQTMKNKKVGIQNVTNREVRITTEQVLREEDKRKELDQPTAAEANKAAGGNKEETVSR